MKTICFINSVDYGSTGNIALSIIEILETQGVNGCLLVPKSRLNTQRSREKVVIFGNIYLRNISLRLTRVSGLNGCFNYLSAISLIWKLRILKPDIVHIHNLHDSYVNIPIVLKFLKKNNIPLVWTLHDCWAFTGRCPHFDVLGCDKWKTGCNGCSYPKDQYPQSKVDRSEAMWALKKKWFTGVENMTIVTPSKWLAGLVKESFLKDYPVRVINNGIDLNIFKPCESGFRRQNSISDGEWMVLGVAFGWGSRKGLDVFIELGKRLPKKYHIVLVGTDENTDKALPERIISIHRTQNQQELAEIYSAADLFVNPTREEVLGMVNIEALACGTPVVTFDTGGSPECIDESCGAVVPCDDIDALEREIVRICEMKPYSREACLKRAKAFDMNDRFQEYIDLYNEVVSK